MNRVLGVVRQCFDMLACDLNQIGLAVGEETEFEYLASEPIALTRREIEISAINEDAGKSVSGALRQPQRFRQFTKRERPSSNRFDHVETAKKGLATSTG